MTQVESTVSNFIRLQTLASGNLVVQGHDFLQYHILTYCTATTYAACTAQ